MHTSEEKKLLDSLFAEVENNFVRKMKHYYVIKQMENPDYH